MQLYIRPTDPCDRRRGERPRRGRRDGSGAAEPRRRMRRGLQMSRSTNLFVCRKGKNPSTSNRSDAAVLAGTNAAVPTIGGAAG